MIKKVLLVTILFIGGIYSCAAETQKSNFFIYTKKDEVNLRNGPGGEYRIIARFKRAGIPLKVIYSLEGWYLVKDLTDEMGWVRMNMVARKKKTIIIKENTAPLCHYPDIQKCITIAILHKNTILPVIMCGNLWCRVKVNSRLTGWVEKKYIWGE